MGEVIGADRFPVKQMAAATANSNNEIHPTPLVPKMLSAMSVPAWLSAIAPKTEIFCHGKKVAIMPISAADKKANLERCIISSAGG